MIKVGVTGGIGSGKTTVCKIIESLGFPVYYADDRAKWIMNNDSNCKEKIISEFGEKSYSKNLLNREYLSKVVFSDNDKIIKLNTIVHPLVTSDFEKWVNSQSSKFVFKEAALMFETDSWKSLDKIILVSAPIEDRINRVLKRDLHRNKNQILDIISKQMAEEEKIKKADFIIQNKDINEIKEQLQNVLMQL